MKETRISSILYSFPGDIFNGCTAKTAMIFYKSGYHKFIKFYLGQKLPMSAVHFIMGGDIERITHTFYDGTMSMVFRKVGSK